ncbi:thiol-specific monooxygenase [Favolaschia claudopus]|uniref:Thiol-specific monooxygenase n=1 Tax=Favolaschia claudopus TaxID=2862362 RepID=A0AAW0AXH2_9AGAR
MFLTPKPRRILIVGGGPCGLAALRNLTERGDFEEVVLMERRKDVGGVWYLEDPPSPPPSSPTHTNTATDATTPRNYWPSPAYPALIGNVLPEYLSFSGHPFPLPLATHHPTHPQPYPTLLETHAYLKAFAAPYLEKGVIRLEREVVGVDEVGEEEGGGWMVRVRDWRGGVGEESVERWDAVVIATAWYDFPVWPAIPGLAEARAAGMATHAQTWHGPGGFQGKRTLVIGNANSANDIVAQLKLLPSSTPAAPVYRSTRRPALRRFAFLPDARVRDVPPVLKFTLATGVSADEDEQQNEDDKEDEIENKAEKTLTVHLRGGEILQGIDRVVLGTGYSAAAAPFVRVLRNHSSSPSPPSPSLPPSPSPSTSPPSPSPSPSASSRGPRRLYPLTTPHTSPPRIPALYSHILYAFNPTLAFVGAVMSYTPFVVGDLVGWWLSLVWQGRIAIPATIEGRLEGERGRVERVSGMRGAAGDLVDKTTSSGSRMDGRGEVEESHGNGREKENEEVEAEEASSLLAYHILGKEELGYARGLRGEILAAVGWGGEKEDSQREEELEGGEELEDRKEKEKAWAASLPTWSDEEWARREGMYERKWEWLRREAEAELAN